MHLCLADTKFTIIHDFRSGHGGKAVKEISLLDAEKMDSQQQKKSLKTSVIRIKTLQNTTKKDVKMDMPLERN